MLGYTPLDGTLCSDDSGFIYCTKLGSPVLFKMEAFISVRLKIQYMSEIQLKEVAAYAWEALKREYVYVTIRVNCLQHVQDL